MPDFVTKSAAAATTLLMLKAATCCGTVWDAGSRCARLHRSTTRRLRGGVRGMSRFICKRRCCVLLRLPGPAADPLFIVAANGVQR